jgi:osmotically-inducible protein OsmY
MVLRFYEAEFDLGSLAGAAFTPLRSVADDALTPFRDAWITAKARLTVIAVIRDGGSTLSIETHRGCVTLRGEVSSLWASTHAARAVDALVGVVSVRNNLQVTSAAVPRSARHSDAEIGQAVETRLRSNRVLCRSHIRVQDVYDGIVRLAGTAQSKEEDVAAFDEAMQVPGVRRVTSEVVINPSMPSVAVRNLVGVPARRAAARDAAAA